MHLGNIILPFPRVVHVFIWNSTLISLLVPPIKSSSFLEFFLSFKELGHILLILNNLLILLMQLGPTGFTEWTHLHRERIFITSIKIVLALVEIKVDYLIISPFWSTKVHKVHLFLENRFVCYPLKRLFQTLWVSKFHFLDNEATRALVWKLARLVIFTNGRTNVKNSYNEIKFWKEKTFSSNNSWTTWKTNSALSRQVIF